MSIVPQTIGSNVRRRPLARSSLLNPFTVSVTQMAPVRSWLIAFTMNRGSLRRSETVQLLRSVVTGREPFPRIASLASQHTQNRLVQGKQCVGPIVSQRSPSNLWRPSAPPTQMLPSTVSMINFAKRSLIPSASA